MQRALERRFRQYLTGGADFFQLTLALLRELLRDAQRGARLLGREPEAYTIPLKWVLSC